MEYQEYLYSTLSSTLRECLNPTTKLADDDQQDRILPCYI